MTVNYEFEHPGSDMSKESSLDDLLDALQNFSEGSNPDSLASEPPDQVSLKNVYI